MKVVADWMLLSSSCLYRVCTFPEHRRSVYILRTCQSREPAAGTWEGRQALPVPGQTCLVVLVYGEASQHYTQFNTMTVPAIAMWFPNLAPWP